MFPQKLLPLAAIAALAACSPSEPQPAASAASTVAVSTVANPETAASADSAASAPAVSASEAAASAPTAKLLSQNQAKWQRYQCDEGTVEVRYYQSDAGAAAQIRHKGSSYTAPYSAELSDEDLSTFSNGHQSWTIANISEQDFYREGDGFFVQHERPDDAAPDLIVDHLTLQNCQPQP